LSAVRYIAESEEGSSVILAMVPGKNHTRQAFLGVYGTALLAGFA
jgi:hypothetical protein